MTNSDRLQEIKERAEKATEGPWACWDGWGPISSGYLEGLMVMARIGPRGGNSQSVISASGATKQDIYAKRPDAEFIAAAREDIPYLLQLVTEQQREIDRARRTVSNLVGGMCEHKESCQYPQCKCGQPAQAKGYRKQERPI